MILGRLFPYLRERKRRRSQRAKLRRVLVGDRVYLVRPPTPKRRRR